MSQNGVFTVRSQTEGMVREFVVEPGQQVLTGDILGYLEAPQRNLKLHAANEKVAFLETETERLREQIKKEREAQETALHRDVVAKRYSSELLKKQLPTLEEQLKAKQQLHKEGLVALDVVLDAEQVLNQRKIELERIDAELSSLAAQLTKVHRTEEMKAKEQELQAAISERDLIKLSEVHSTIRTNSNGSILGFMLSPGDSVQPGSSLVWLERPVEPNKPHLFYAYVPLENGKKIQEGTEVQIEISTVNQEEYGALIGHVIDVSKYGASTEHITTVIHNRGLVEYLSAGQTALIQVVIEPILNPNTVSGYAWTSEEGPPYPITTGTVGTMKAIVERVSPLYYLLPIEGLRQVVAEAELPSLPNFPSLSSKLKPFPWSTKEPTNPS